MQTFINKNQDVKILSILICSMGKRKSLLDRLLNCIRPQLTKEVEVIIDTDDGELTIGAKRNALIDSAVGEYVAFIDDDDLVSDDYVSKILNALESKPDSCGFQAIITTNGGNAKPVYYSMKYTKWIDEPDAYYRSTQHLSPIKREITTKVRYPDTSFCEDRIYSEDLHVWIETEVIIHGAIYFYDYIPKKSWFKVIKDNDVFYHIEIMAYDVYGSNPLFDNVLLGIGPQFIPSIKELHEKYPNLKPIGYQFEQLFNGSHHVNNKLGEWVNRGSEIWDYDLNNINFIADTFAKNAKFRPLIYSDNLKTIENLSDPDIDVLFYGTTNDRRKTIIDMIKYQNPTRNIVWTSAWGANLDPLIARSKIILNLHYYETCIQEQARMFYPLINNKCIVSEPSVLNYYSDIIREYPTEHLGKAIAYLLDRDLWRDIAKNASNDFRLLSNDIRKRMILD